jgi:hypothetical protein
VDFSGDKRIFKPLYINFSARPRARNRKYVEAAGTIALLAACLQVVLCSPDNPALFAAANRCRRRTVTGVAAKTDLHENQLLTMVADDVNFAGFAAEIPFQKLQACLLQVSYRVVFVVLTLPHRLKPPCSSVFSSQGNRHPVVEYRRAQLPVNAALFVQVQQARVSAYSVAGACAKLPQSPV